MDRILIILKKENGPRASSAPALGLNTIIFKPVYWYMRQTQVSVYRTIGPLVFFLKNDTLFSFQSRTEDLTHNVRGLCPRLSIHVSSVYCFKIDLSF